MNSPVITNHDSDAAERMKAMREIEAEPAVSLGDLLRSVTEPVREAVKLREGYLGVADRYFPLFDGSKEQFEAALGIAYITGQRDAIKYILAKQEAK